ncbi:peptidoglycan DD-metalloendopeptidase family protein [Streptomyces sp. NPDC059373]
MPRAVHASVVTALCLVLALAASPAPAGADDDRSRKQAAATVDRLYGEAARAVRSYETVRKAVDLKRRELNGLREAARYEQGRLGALRERIGEMARTQYREGALTPSAQLFLSAKPDELLEGVTLLHAGNHATAALLRARSRAEQRLEEATSAADHVLDQLSADARRQAAIKRRIQARLARARVVLRTLRTVRATDEGQDCPRARHTDRARPAPRAGLASTTWVSPVEHYRLTAGFASTGAHWAHRHTGQDFAVPVGTPVHAVGDGLVIVAGCGDGFGNQIVIQHACGYYTHYAHLSRLDVEPGDRVRTGDRIGLSGNSGNSTGPHLHFEVRVTPLLGSGVDPVPWMAEHGVPLHDS